LKHLISFVGHKGSQVATLGA